VARIGSDRPIATDVRIVAATNLPPPALGDGSRFRQDLLYRINTVTITLPPLRQRPDDIAPLVEYYMTRFSAKYHKDAMQITPATLAALERYHWPGNIRELVHAVERAVIMSESDALELADLLLPKPAAEPPGPREPRDLPDDLNLSRLEVRAIEAAIAKHNGNLSRAAQELGLGRTTLYRKMAKHGL
jgi:transcriptional regulator with PAS, ATPase and Fis domain